MNVSDDGVGYIQRHNNIEDHIGTLKLVVDFFNIEQQFQGFSSIGIKC